MCKQPPTTRCYSLDSVKMIHRHENNIPIFIYLPPSKGPHNRRNKKLRIRMVNNNNNNVDDDDGGGGKLPPIPTYCEQPSQAEASLGQMFHTDAARENSDPYVDKVADRWKIGHTVPAKNPTGMTYDEVGTERVIVYNKDGLAIPAPRMPERYQQRCSIAGCRNDQMLPQLPCWCYDPKTHARWVHRYCFQEKVLDKYGFDHPDPNQRRSKMKYMQIGACTKACYVKYDKYVASNDVESLPFEEDGKKGRDDPINSASIIMDWISKSHNYDCYTGAHDKKHTKAYYENQIAHEIATAGVRKKRTGKDVKNYIGRKVDSWKRANEWASNTGQGILDAGDHKQFKDAVLAKCPHYYVMEHILGARAGVRPIMNSDTAHVDDEANQDPDDDVLMGTYDTDSGSSGSSGGEERRRIDREEQERVQIESAKKMSLDEADARCLDNQFDEHMEENIARVKDEDEFPMPTPRPMGATGGGVIDLSASFSSSSASNKGGNAAVAAITASTNNSAKKMLFSKKNKGAGSVSSKSKKKSTSTKKRRSSLSSVSTDGLSGRTMATSSLSKSRGFSSATRDKREKDKNHPDVMLQQMCEHGKAKELRRVQVQAVEDVRTQKLFEIEVEAKEAQAAVLQRQAAALERKAEAEELETQHRMEQADAAFFFKLYKEGMPKGQIKNFYPRLAKFCNT